MKIKIKTYKMIIHFLVGLRTFQHPLVKIDGQTAQYDHGKSTSIFEAHFENDRDIFKLKKTEHVLKGNRLWNSKSTKII